MRSPFKRMITFASFRSLKSTPRPYSITMMNIRNLGLSLKPLWWILNFCILIYKIHMQDIHAATDERTCLSLVPLVYRQFLHLTPKILHAIAWSLFKTIEVKLARITNHGCLSHDFWRTTLNFFTQRCLIHLLQLLSHLIC